MDLLRGPFHDSDLRIMVEHGLHSSTDDEPALASNERRRYKAYTVMTKSGFQHTEYISIMLHLCRAELLISLGFLAHSVGCPAYAHEAEYQSTCHMNGVAAIVGLFTAGLGIASVQRIRWRSMLMLWLVSCIISSVGNLLAVITVGIWLDHLSKMKERTGWSNGLSGMMLLAQVAVGVCFILTAVMICHYWGSHSTKYQAVGKVAKRSRSVRRRPSGRHSGTERSGQSKSGATSPRGSLQVV